MVTAFGRRRFLGLAGTAVALSTAGCGLLDGEDDSWPQFRANARRTGHNPAAGGPRGEVELGWSVETDGEALSGPVVADGVAYLNGGGAAALETVDGREAWSTPLPFDSGIAPIVGEEHLYVPGRHALHAFDRTDGAREWHYSLARHAVNAPVLDDERVYVGFREADSPFQSSLSALDPETGEEQWRAPVGTGDVLLFVPAVDEDLLAVGKEAVYALDPGTGDELWTFEDPDARFGPPILADGRVYVGANTSEGGLVFGLDAADGAERWRFATGLGARGIAFEDGSVYAASDAVYALDAADGSVRWRLDSNQFAHSSPALGSDRLYLGGLAGDVIALDPADGDGLWRIRTDGVLLSSPTVVGGAVYVSSQNGILYRVVGT